MVSLGDVLAPQAPQTESTGVSLDVLKDLALKLAYTVPHLTTKGAVQELHLPQPVVADLLEQLRLDRLVEVLGQEAPFDYRFAITLLGRERAARLFEVSGYVGPAPVSLEAYTALLEWQLADRPPVTPGRVSAALAGMVLRPQIQHLAGLAASSGRSLFLYGPAGNGKTTLGRKLHEVLEGDLWVPYCIGIDQSIIRVFDPQIHEPVQGELSQPWLLDRRWVRVHRPLVVVGGEATIESFDLLFSPSLRFYEAPVHVKANGGTFLIDDFGRQRVDPHDLLNRWIIPLERRIDYLTLQTGQKIQVPFRQMLIIATNLSASAVTDPAFLRRMGYRLHLEPPTAELYTAIFQRYAEREGLAVPAGMVGRLLERYHKEGRDLRCCEPGDLIGRVRDICRFQGHKPQLTDEFLDLAWTGYFGPSSEATTPF
jgi:hypothetical protein